MDKSHFNFSYIATELNDEGVPVPRLKVHSGTSGVDLDYSESEYRVFIDYFGKISRDIRDVDETGKIESEFTR